MNAHPSAALADAKLIASQSLSSSAEVKSKSEQSLSGSFSSLRTLLARAARPKNNGTMIDSGTDIGTDEKERAENPGNGHLLDGAPRGDVPVVRMLTRVSYKLTARNFLRSLAFDRSDECGFSERRRLTTCGGCAALA